MARSDDLERVHALMLLVFAASSTTLGQPNTIALSDPFGCGHNYYFVRQKSNWSSSENYCQSQFGGHLVKIDSLHENKFLIDVIKSQNDLNLKQFWIGGFSITENPIKWSWTCGTTSFQYGSQGYRLPWSHTQPDRASERCVHLWSTWEEPGLYEWNNFPCHGDNLDGTPFFFICETCRGGAC